MKSSAIAGIALLLLVSSVLQGCGEKYHMCNDAISGCVGTVRACLPDQDKATSQCKICYSNVEDSSLSDKDKKKYQQKCLTEDGRQDIPDNIHKETTTHWSGKELLLPLRKFMQKQRSLNNVVASESFLDTVKGAQPDDAPAPAPVGASEKPDIPQEVWMGYHRKFAKDYFNHWDHWSTTGDHKPPGDEPLQPYNIMPERQPRKNAQHVPYDYPE